jgi:hypothetical protein
MLDLQGELDKMGLTKSSYHVLQKSMTKVFYMQWNYPNKIQAQTIMSSVTQEANKSHRFMCYPMSTLNSRRIVELPAAIVGNIKGRKLVLEKKVLRQLGGVKQFDWNHPVTAVFATNCRAFQLESKNVTIDHSDVDWEGKLNVALPDGFVSNLLKNVELRFLFF